MYFADPLLFLCDRFCLAVLRDITERGRDLEQVLSQYITFVKPAFEEFCLPVSCLDCVPFRHGWSLVPHSVAVKRFYLVM